MSGNAAFSKQWRDVEGPIRQDIAKTYHTILKTCAFTAIYLYFIEQRPNEKLLAELYDRFAQGDIAGVIAMCDESMVYKVPGSVPTSGIYDNKTFLGIVQKAMEISNGTFEEKVIDIIANDYHGIVFLEHSLERNGKRIEYRTTHRYQIKNGKFISWEEYPGSMTEFNEAWA